MIKRLIQKTKDGTVLQILQELRWIGSYNRRYLWAIGWYILLGILGTVITLAASVVSKDIIDIVTGYQAGYAVQAAVIYVAMQLTTIGLKAAASRISAKVQLRVSQQLRLDVFGKIMRAQWEPLSEFHSGDLLTRSSRDTDTVAGSVISWVPSLIVNLLQFAGTFIILFWFDSTLALLALASAPITLVMSGFLVKRIRKHSKRLRQIGSETAAFHTEAFGNIQFIKAFHAVDIYCSKLKNIQQKHKEATLEHNRFSVLTSSFMSLVGMVVGGVCFLWSAYRLWGNHITFGEMTLFLQMSGSLSGAFGALVSLVPAAITAATAAGRIMEITQLPAEEIQCKEQVDALLKTGSNIGIRAENVAFSYQSGKEVFRNVSFQAEPGEIVALVGPSGGGKTTLLRLLLGLIPPQEGNIYLQGENQETTLCAAPSTRSLFSYVPQDNTLFSGTIAENLRITNPDATDDMLVDALKMACAYDFVSALPQGLDSRVGESGDGLSKGQIQRISVARALLSDAPVLLLDEATSALDVKTQRAVLENITRFRKGRTCVITTHRPSVLSICQRAYLIRNQTVAPVKEEQLKQIMEDL